MKPSLATTPKIVNDPEAFATLSVEDKREVLANQLMLTAAMVRIWLNDGHPEEPAKPREGDRLLGTKEICARLGCSMSTLMVGWKKGRYPFLLKDGGRLVGSEDGLERWIKNRIKRSA